MEVKDLPVAEARFGRLVTIYGERVYRKAYGMVKDPYLAQDVMQETFLKAYRHLDTVQDERRAGAWLSKIAANAAIDLMRKRKCWNGVPTDANTLAWICGAASGCVEEEVLCRLGAEMVHTQIDRLHPAYRDVVRMKVTHGLRDAEIAEKLGVSVGTVKSRFHRAKRIIRGWIDDSLAIAGTSPEQSANERLLLP